jgi:hypothetical protein
VTDAGRIVQPIEFSIDPPIFAAVISIFIAEPI